MYIVILLSNNQLVFGLPVKHVIYYYYFCLFIYQNILVLFKSVMFTLDQYKLYLNIFMVYQSETLYINLIYLFKNLIKIIFFKL